MKSGFSFVKKKQIILENIDICFQLNFCLTQFVLLLAVIGWGAAIGVYSKEWFWVSSIYNRLRVDTPPVFAHTLFRNR